MLRTKKGLWVAYDIYCRMNNYQKSDYSVFKNWFEGGKNNVN